MGRDSRARASRRELRRVQARLDTFLCGNTSRASGARCERPAEWELEVRNRAFRRLGHGIGEVEHGVHTVLACGEHKEALRRSGAAVSFRKIERAAARS